MRLGIDIRELERDRMTGIGRYLRNLVEHVRRTRPEHPLFLYANQRTDTSLEGGTARVRTAREGITLWYDQVLLPRLARQDGIDVFLSPYVKGPLCLPCPLAITVHDLMPLVFPQYAGRWHRLRNWGFRAMARRVARRADLIFTDSQYSAGDIRRLLRVEATRVEVLPIGLEERYRPVTDPGELQAMRDACGLGEPYVYYLGNYKPHKNVATLIRAFAALDAALRGQHLLALGGREDRWQPAHRRLAAELGVADRVRFLGAVPEERMPALYSGALVFAFPSLYEGFGLPPLEAMACGTPVVAAGRTSLPEVVGDAGLLVDGEDVAELSAALARLLTDADERQRLRRRGLERAARFRAADVCERQVRRLERLAEEGR